jgi:hypothetical protein
MALHRLDEVAHRLRRSIRREWWMVVLVPLLAFGTLGLVAHASHDLDQAVSTLKARTVTGYKRVASIVMLSLDGVAGTLEDHS